MIRLSVVLATLAATACGSLPGTALAQEPAPEPTRQIHVNADASVRRAPDRAVVQLAVESVGETARAATDANAEAMAGVLAALRRLDIPSERIQTLRIELQPQYDRRRDAAEPRIVGYRALNQVVVRVDDLGAVGPVVDAAVSAGANRVTGIQFELAEPESAYHEALRLAIAKARAEAEVVAAALDESLGPPISVSTGGFHVPQPMMRDVALRAAEAMPAPPVEPGEMEVRASVSITYRLGS
jgi:uncharacterized protein YggE